MPIRSVGPSCLPDHQLHVSLTLGHADSSLLRLGEVLHDFLTAAEADVSGVAEHGARLPCLDFEVLLLRVLREAVQVLLGQANGRPHDPLSGTLFAFGGIESVSG